MQVLMSFLVGVVVVYIGKGCLLPGTRHLVVIHEGVEVVGPASGSDHVR